VVDVNEYPSEHTICRPFSIPNPLRGVQFGQGAELLDSNTPVLRPPEFEDEDDDEDENEAPCEGGS
jgi:hypothetical protein